MTAQHHIIWINGAFGAGKTTLAQTLQQRLTGAVIFDPEDIGALLCSILPPSSSGDFQDMPAWRRLVLATATVLYKECRYLIIPMTLVRPQYQHEILSGLQQLDARLLHYFLDVPAVELERRILAQVIHPDDAARDQATRDWRLAQIARCTAASRSLPESTWRLSVTTQSVAFLADEVLDRLASSTVVR